MEISIYSICICLRTTFTSLSAFRLHIFRRLSLLIAAYYAKDNIYLFVAYLIIREKRGLECLKMVFRLLFFGIHFYVYSLSNFHNRISRACKLAISLKLKIRWFKFTTIFNVLQQKYTKFTRTCNGSKRKERTV